VLQLRDSLSYLEILMVVNVMFKLSSLCYDFGSTVWEAGLFCHHDVQSILGRGR
jgi:hypothetical protein